MSGTQAAARVPTTPEPGSNELRKARRLLALTPLGLIAGFLLVTLIASSMGLYVMSVVMEGAPATTLQRLFLTVVAEVVVLPLPLTSVFLAHRAHQAGHPNAKPTAVAGIVLSVGAALLPIIGVPGQPPTPADDTWKHWAVDVDLAGLPQTAYEQGQSWPETRSNGAVIAVHTPWRTDRSPQQACTDFARALTSTYPDTVLGPVDDLGCLVRADGERIIVQVHGGSMGSGAVVDIIQQNMSPQEP